MDATRERYWLKRELANSSKAYNFAEKKLAKLKREYQKAIKEIEKRIENFWKEYATEEGLTIAEAQRKLNNSKVKPDLEEYLRLVKEIDDPVAQAMLREMGKKVKLSRLEHLKLQIEKEISRLFGVEQTTAKEALIETYEFGYYRHIYEIQKAIGAGKDFEVLTPRAVDRAISTAWSGQNYSQRIWGHRKLVAKKVEQIITQGIILGQSNQQMAGKLSEALQASYSRAKTLIRTETNYVYNQATLKGYEATGLDGYIFLATLDSRTSEICQSLDGRRFKLKEAQVGKNYPPMHPNCRSTTIPDVEGALEGDRVAKLGRQYYPVDGDITYNEWYNRYVAGRAVETTPRSLGAAARRIFVESQIKLGDTPLYIKEGSYITGVKVIAGKGVKRKIDDVHRLVSSYRLPNGEATRPQDWQKVRGTAEVVQGDKLRKAEVHWYQCQNVGKVEYKLKRWLDEG